MKTLSDSTLRGLNRNALIKTIKELYAENEILRKNAEYNDKVVNEVRWNANIYKSRMYEAIEYIKERGCYDEETKVCCDDIDYYAIPKLLDILQGGNNE